MISTFFTWFLPSSFLGGTCSCHITFRAFPEGQTHNLFVSDDQAERESALWRSIYLPLHWPVQSHQRKLDLHGKGRLCSSKSPESVPFCLCYSHIQGHWLRHMICVFQVREANRNMNRNTPRKSHRSFVHTYIFKALRVVHWLCTNYHSSDLQSSWAQYIGSLSQSLFLEIHCHSPRVVPLCLARAIRHNLNLLQA